MRCRYAACLPVRFANVHLPVSLYALPGCMSLPWPLTIPGTISSSDLSIWLRSRRRYEPAICLASLPRICDSERSSVVCKQCVLGWLGPGMRNEISIFDADTIYSYIVRRGNGYTCLSVNWKSDRLCGMMLVHVEDLRSGIAVWRGYGKLCCGGRKNSFLHFCEWNFWRWRVWNNLRNIQIISFFSLIISPGRET